MRENADQNTSEYGHFHAYHSRYVGLEQVTTHYECSLNIFIQFLVAGTNHKGETLNKNLLSYTWDRLQYSYTHGYILQI